MSHRELSSHKRRRNIYKQRNNIASADGISKVKMGTIHSHRHGDEHNNRFVKPTQVAVQVLDEYGCLMSVNNSWLLATRYRREDVIGHWFGEYLVAYDKSQFSSTILSAIRSSQRSKIILRMLREDMSIIIVRCIITIIYDEYDIHKKYYCTLEDITNYILVNGELENGNDHIHLSCATLKHDEMW